MEEAAARTRLARARVGVLATVRPDGGPHIVPVVFASMGRTIVTAIDHKPKTTTRLQRLTNIGSDSRVSLLVHSYAEDWASLWWVRADGVGKILDRGSEHSEAIQALQVKYIQYRHRPPTGPVIALAVEHVAGWSGSGT